MFTLDVGWRAEQTDPASRWTGRIGADERTPGDHDAMARSLLLVEGVGEMRSRSATRGVGWFRGTVGVLGAFALMVLIPASPAAADPPIVDTFEVTIEDVDPCTGDMHSVSVEFTLYQHFHGDRFVEHGTTSITTTPTGFVGSGTLTLVDNARLFLFRSLYVLTDETGNRILASASFVRESTTGEMRVERIDLRCVHAAT